MNIIDIGSAGGLPKRLSEVSGKIISFDPFEKERKNVYECGVFDEVGPKKFYVYEKVRCSSFYKLNYELIKQQYGKIPEQYKLKKEIDVHCVSLDDVLPIEHEYQFLKIDAEGAELGIIKGAQQSLKSISYIEVESYTSPRFVGAPLFPEVKETLESLGFSLVGHLREMKKSPDFNDWIFMKKDANHKRLRKIYKQCNQLVI